MFFFKLATDLFLYCLYFSATSLLHFYPRIHRGLQVFRPGQKWSHINQPAEASNAIGGPKPNRHTDTESHQRKGIRW